MENKKIRNKIIALSGEPVAGKGTTTKALVEALQSTGYSQENIHVISTGNEFRKYFSLVLRFIDNLKNDDIEEYETLAATNEIREIANNPKYLEAFRKSATTIARKNIDVSHMSIEEMNNLPELAAIRKAIDLLIDGRMERIGTEINREERTNEIWILDSRLAFHNVPEAFAVRLTANPDVAAKRLLGDNTRGREDNNYNNIEEAKQARENRKLGEQQRYLQRYGVDLEDPNNYDLIIDTSYAEPTDIADTILDCLEYSLNNKPFAKMWTSPKILLPMQGERETLGTATLSFDEMIESIQNNGFVPSKPIEIVEADGYKGIVEGHHRNFAAAALGKTLVPYEVIGRDDEKIIYGGFTPRERIQSIDKNILLGHEWMIEEGERKAKGEKVTFSYSDVYPKIFEKIQNREIKDKDDMER